MVGRVVTVQYQLWKVASPQRRQARKVRQQEISLLSKAAGGPFMEDREVQEEAQGGGAGCEVVVNRDCEQVGRSIYH